MSSRGLLQRTSPHGPARAIVRALDRVLLGAKAKLGLREHLRSGRATLPLSAGHTLPMHQRHYPLYDRFLPHLAQHLDPGAVVIDVGANCGDTLAGMYARNAALEFVAVEPDDRFFALLESNVATLSQGDPSLRTHLVKSLVGQQVAGATLVGSGGTARAVVGDNGGVPTHRSRTLDDILTDLKITDVRLLKSDVDGFDYDVISSARETLVRSHPLVFFETQIDHQFQRDGFVESLAMLEGLGYRYWLLFDNFGSLCVRTEDHRVATQLIAYPWNNRVSESRRTVNYFDVLAGTEADRAFMDHVADEYDAIAARR